MEDDMLFCQKCGTKFMTNESVIAESTVEKKTDLEQASKVNGSYEPTPKKVPKKSNLRTSMKIWMVVCFVFAGIYALVAIAETAIIAMTLFFGILGIMFLCLAKTPKGSTFLFGKDKGIKKKHFVWICIAVAFISFGVIFNIIPMSSPNTTPPIQNEDVVTNEQSNTSVESEKPQKKVSLVDVEKWYENEMPAVSQNLVEYSKNVKGLSNMNITESKFRFGEEDGWYDCHYTYLFTCKVNGEKCMGEARAFKKYNDSNIDWFHFEIAKESDWSTVVEDTMNLLIQR